MRAILEEALQPIFSARFKDILESAVLSSKMPLPDSVIKLFLKHLPIPNEETIKAGFDKLSAEDIETICKMIYIQGAKFQSFFESHDNSD